MARELLVSRGFMDSTAALAGVGLLSGWGSDEKYAPRRRTLFRKEALSVIRAAPIGVWRYTNSALLILTCRDLVAMTEIQEFWVGPYCLRYPPKLRNLAKEARVFEAKLRGRCGQADIEVNDAKRACFSVRLRISQMRKPFREQAPRIIGGLERRVIADSVVPFINTWKVCPVAFPT